MDLQKENPNTSTEVELGNLNKNERRLLKQKLREEQRAKQSFEQKSINKRRTLKTFIIILMAALLVGGGVTGFVVYSNNKPGPFDNFAKCITEKGAIMYGAISWCVYTKEQAAMFGKSFKYVNYKEFQEGPNIKITPTWIINGQKYEKVQSFQRLSELTGCSL